jgi:bacterial/archaeal transporter family protein
MGWLIPSALYVVLVGALGVTSKLALRSLSWPDLILWTGIGYIVVAGILLALGETSVRIAGGTGWAVLSGAIAIGGLIALYLALGAGDAGKVVAISAAYPAVTLVLAAAVLSEALTLGRVVGTLLIIAGVAVVSLAR